MKNGKLKDGTFTGGPGSDNNHSASLSRRVRQMYLQVGLIGLLIAVTLWYAMNTGSQVAEKYSPLVDAAMEIKFEAALAHLWFEELIGGDYAELTEVSWLEHLAQAEWYAQAMLEGGENDEGTIVPLDDPVLRDNIVAILVKIQAFRGLANERLTHLDKSAIGSDIDQRFDVLFNSFQRGADDVKSSLQVVMKREIQRFRLIQLALLVSCVILTGIVGVILHRFQRRQSTHVAMLNAANHQLKASEQQLKAANQQLTASEQQLRATNQQLTASEQQLKATNQQLMAGEQQLKAANQQLKANEQQLITANQQLMAGEQQLRATNQQLMASEQQLKASNQQLRAREQQLQVINHSLGERVKELQCMYGVTESILTRINLEDLFQDVAELIPPGWHYPEITRGKIIFDGKEYIAEPFTETKWKQSSDIIVNGKSRGSIEVYYLRECEELDEGPFMQEERSLINGMAKAISEAVGLKQAKEETLRVSTRLQMSIEQMPLGYILWDSDLKVLEWNNAAERIFGYASEEMVGKSLFKAIVPDEALPYVDEVAKELFSGRPSSYSEKNNNVRKDGTLISCHWYNAPICNTNGEVTAILSMAEDVTARTQIKDRLKESEETFRRITERTSDIIMLVNNDEQITYVSPAVTRILGYQPAEMINKRVSQFVPENEVTKVIQQFKLTESGGSVEAETSVMTRKSGELVDVEINAVPICKDNRVVGAQGIIRDITETKRLQALESRAERLETAGTIAGQVAHDFNNLLAPIMAYPEFIHEELPHDHKAHAYLDAIEDAAKRIANINQDLLTLGRRGHYNQNVLDLNRVVLLAAQEMETWTRTVTSEMKLDENLMKIKGGVAQIHRAFTNLLVNAHDAMDGIGQITIRTENYYADDTSVAFGRVPKGEYVKLTVSDNGCGISEEIIEKILDPFFSTKNSDKKRGSGLGLSVVDAVMKDHQGYLDLQSRVGHGTSFYLYFPVTREETAEDKSERPAGGTESILVIDDDKIQREVSSQLLRKLGYQVRSVESGERALKFLRENPHDLLILDMVMPGGIDGAETYRSILDFSPQQKAIILSGFSESERIFTVQSLGAGAFVRKPITKNVIAAAVRTELDRKVEHTAS